MKKFFVTTAAMKKRLFIWMICIALWPGHALAALLSVESADIWVASDSALMLFGIGTPSGYTPPNANLNYAFLSGGGTSAIVLNLNGTPISISAMSIITPLFSSGSGLGAYLEGKNVTGDIELTYHFEIVNNPSSGVVADTVMFKYVLENVGIIPHVVGLRVQIDTQVILNDGANVSVDNGFSVVTNSLNWKISDGLVPSDWWIYDIAPPGVANLVGRAHLAGNAFGVPANPPDVLEVSSWGNVSTANQWALAPLGTFISDSAVVIWWTGTGNESGPALNLNPGESIEFVTYYGINQGVLLATPTLTPTPGPAATATYSPTVSVTPTRSSTFTISPTPTVSPTPTPTAPKLSALIESSESVVLVENEFSLIFSTNNVGSAVASPVTIFVSIPPGLEILDTAGGTVSGAGITWVIPFLNPGDEFSASIDLRPLSGTEGEQLLFDLLITYENASGGIMMPTESAQTAVVVTQPSYIRIDRNAFSGPPARIRIEIVSILDSAASVNIYNSSGELVKREYNRKIPGGLPEKIYWDGTNQNGEPCSSGVYIIRVEMADLSLTKRVAIIR